MKKRITRYITDDFGEEKEIVGKDLVVGEMGVLELISPSQPIFLVYKEEGKDYIVESYRFASFKKINWIMKKNGTENLSKRSCEPRTCESEQDGAVCFTHWSW